VQHCCRTNTLIKEASEHGALESWIYVHCFMQGVVIPVECAQAAGYTGKVKIGMDVAASEFLTKDNKYDLDFKTKDNDGSQVLTG
jgi:hypothetical protein